METVLGLILELIKRIFPLNIEKNSEQVYNLVKRSLYTRAEGIVVDNGTFDTILDAMVPIGLAFVVLYWLINILKTLNIKNVTVDMLLRSFIRLLVGCILINNLGLMFPAFNDFAHKLTTEIKDHVEEDGTFSMAGYAMFFDQNDLEGNKNDTENYLTDQSKKEPEETTEDEDEISYENKGVLRAGMAILQYLAYLILLQLLKISVACVSYTRMLAIGRKMLYAPIGCANIFDQIDQNQGVKYVKEIFAIFMQEPVVYCILLIGSYLLESALGTDFWIQLFVFIGTSTLVFKSQSISRQLFA